jgi:hypothetical protein
VIHAAFDPGGKRIITAALDGTARVWDAAAGLPLTEPLRSDHEVLYATFGPDGQRVVTAGADATARLWEVPMVPQRPVPQWVAGWAESVVGLHIDGSGNAIELEWAERKRLEEQARSHASGDDYYGRIVEWFYHEDPATRTISPFSTVTLRDYVENRMLEKDPNGGKSVWRKCSAWPPGTLQPTRRWQRF